MKIALITLHAIKNYGSVLQTLATQEIFREFGYETELINFIREDSLDENLLDYWCGNNLIKKIVMIPTLIRWKTVFNQFVENHFKLTEHVYTKPEDFEKYPIEADLYCTGSDQVWNAEWNEGIIKSLYLDFVPEDKFRFAYSASFGRKELSKAEVAETKEYINKYNFISVREDYAKEMLAQYYGFKNAVHLVDPTLAISSGYWRGLEKESKINGDYILEYNLNRSREFDNYVKRLGKKLDMPVYFLCRRYDQIFRPGKSILVPDVLEFITLIDHAKYVVTDSFHATAFSLNLNTEPVCIYPEKFGGRLESLLRMTGTTQKHVMDYDDLDVINRKIDFEKVTEILDQERRKTRNYLQDVFSDFEERTVVNYKIR